MGLAPFLLLHPIQKGLYFLPAVFRSEIAADSACKCVLQHLVEFILCHKCLLCNQNSLKFIKKKFFVLIHGRSRWGFLSFRIIKDRAAALPGAAGRPGPAASTGGSGLGNVHIIAAPSCDGCEELSAAASSSSAAAVSAAAAAAYRVRSGPGTGCVSAPTGNVCLAVVVSGGVPAGRANRCPAAAA